MTNFMLCVSYHNEEMDQKVGSSRVNLETRERCLEKLVWEKNIKTTLNPRRKKWQINRGLCDTGKQSSMLLVLLWIRGEISADSIYMSV